MDLRKRHFWHLILCSMVIFQFVSLYFLLQARQKDILVTVPSTGSDSQTKELTHCETVVYKQSTEDDTVYSDMWYTSEINPKTLLLILIFSRPASGDLRITCRNTWLKDYRDSTGVIFRFVIGTYGLSEKENWKLCTESEQYGDLLFFENHMESYGHQCTNKLLLSFKWVAHQLEAQYVMKTDDDCYIRLGFVLSLLHKRTTLTKKPFLCGTIICNELPNSEGKWKEENWNLTKEYLPFPLGSGYILPMSLVKTIVESNKIVPLRKLRNEDVTVGVWVAQYDIDYININRYSEPKKEFTCPQKDAGELVIYHCLQNSTLMYTVHNCTQG